MATFLTQSGEQVQEILDKCERIENKVTSLSPESTDTEYPSAKCVFDFVGGAVGNIEAILATI